MGEEARSAEERKEGKSSQKAKGGTAQGTNEKLPPIS